MEDGLHSSQIVMMALGGLFIVFAGIILKYNFRRKSKRVNHKMPSGNIFISLMALSGIGMIYYGLVMEVPKPSPKEILMQERAAKSLNELSGETSKPDEDNNFLKAVSSSAKKK